MSRRAGTLGSEALLSWRNQLRAPVIAAPLFIASTPALVLAQCTGGIIGTFPALNARSSALFEEWLAQLSEAPKETAPFGVNLIVHRSNPRFEADLALCEKYRVPLVISSMGASEDVNRVVHGYGGSTLHDITTQAHARKAIDRGADGLIAVAAGAGGHAGTTSPFALVSEIREWFDGPLALAGAIGTGRGVLAARTMGADFAYVGSAFIATHEAGVGEEQKLAMVEATADDIVYTPAFSGTPANYLKGSIVAQGLDPATLPASRRELQVGNQAGAAKTWTEIWGSGQGVGATKAVEPASEVIERLVREYREALDEVAASAR